MIPIYRAKKLDGDEWAEGVLSPCGKYIVEYLSQLQKPYPFDEYILVTSKYDEIDPKTLAIHFQNMIDKNGKNIFASLGEDGIGGDILDYKNIIVGYDPSNMMFNAQRDGYAIDMENLNRFKVIGIHKGE